MNEYTVILVDDEKEVRDSILRKLDWSLLGFRVIGSAENGEEALEMAQRLQPDVVMTDIKMPFMDGLTFCQKLKKTQRNVKIIIFSGFDEFEYAKEAIKLEVEEYILKPINATELANVFERIHTLIDQELDEKRNIDKLARYYQASLPILRDQFIIGLLDGQVAKERIEEFNKHFELHLESQYYTVSVVRFDSTDEVVDINGSGISNSQLMVLSLKKIVDENLDGVITFKSIVYLESIIIIAMLSSEAQISQLIYTMDHICKNAKKVFDMNTTAGIGRVCYELDELIGSYKEALNAVDYRVLMEPNQAIYIQDIEPKMDPKSNIQEELLGKIIKAIKLGEKEEIKESTGEMVQFLRTANLSLEKYQFFLIEILTEIFKIGRSYGLNADGIVGRELELFEEFKKINSMTVLETKLLGICMGFRDSIRRERSDTTRLIIERAKEYINHNYSDSSLSVDTLSTYLNVSAGHFSTMFKRETGMTFINYLTKTRLDTALQLLNTTDDKTYIIASKVGYEEPNYFSYVFKKEYKIAPSKYRATKAENYEKKS